MLIAHSTTHYASEARTFLGSYPSQADPRLPGVNDAAPEN